MTRIIAIAALCLFCSSDVIAEPDGIWNPPIQAVGNAGHGVNNPGTSGGSPPASCDGTIDLSTGCVQPMLGAL